MKPPFESSYQATLVACLFDLTKSFNALFLTLTPFTTVKEFFLCTTAVVGVRREVNPEALLSFCPNAFLGIAITVKQANRVAANTRPAMAVIVVFLILFFVFVLVYKKDRE